MEDPTVLPSIPEYGLAWPVPTQSDERHRYGQHFSTARGSGRRICFSTQLNSGPQLEQHSTASLPRQGRCLPPGQNCQTPVAQNQAPIRVIAADQQFKPYEGVDELCHARAGNT